MPFHFTGLNEVAANDLSAGDSYLTILADQKTSTHGLVGTNNPTEHLAVWGSSTRAFSNLAIASNQSMIDSYQVAHVLKIEGDTRINQA